ncbi:MAG: NnrU family protein [Cypionkella sp.]
MGLLIVGVLLWAYSHLMKRVTPGFRASLGDNNGKMVATGLTILAIVFMVVGYRSADVVQLWNPPAFLRHINNLLMLIAIFLVLLGFSRGVLRTKIRHPMLTGVKTWAIAHLLVNGDLASLILFGGILAWAVVDLIMINKMVPNWTPPKAGPIYFDVIHLVVSVLVMGVIGMIHAHLGYPVFG